MGNVLMDFQAVFGHVPAVKASAPGRVNLIGEHTDYNGGLVLPALIPQRTFVECSPRADNLVRASSANIAAGGIIREYLLGDENAGQDWLDYLQGITRILSEEGHRIRGFDVRIDSSVPIGSGLASSAALEIALLRALRIIFALPLDDLELALIGQRAENSFVGAHVGIMDQMTAGLAREGAALFIDTRSLEYEQVAFPPSLDLVVINSGVKHRHASGEYNARRDECERACKLLGIPQLRDLGVADLPRLGSLPDALVRRARHVITENERVTAAVEAMRTGDLNHLGQLFYASHESMRDDYEVSIPEIDLLVEIARRMPDVYGARLTGGGFGGSVVILARRATGHGVAKQIAQQYAVRSGCTPVVLLPDGAPVQRLQTADDRPQTGLLHRVRKSPMMSEVRSLLSGLWGLKSEFRGSKPCES